MKKNKFFIKRINNLFTENRRIYREINTAYDDCYNYLGFDSFYNGYYVYSTYIYNKCEFMIITFFEGNRILSTVQKIKQL